MFRDVSSAVPYVRSDILPDCAVHAFTTRAGGVSTGHLSSLNLGVSRGDSDTETWL